MITHYAESAWCDLREAIRFSLERGAEEAEALAAAEIPFEIGTCGSGVCRNSTDASGSLVFNHYLDR